MFCGIRTFFLLRTVYSYVRISGLEPYPFCFVSFCHKIYILSKVTSTNSICFIPLLFSVIVNSPNTTVITPVVIELLIFFKIPLTMKTDSSAEEKLTNIKRSPSPKQSGNGRSETTLNEVATYATWSMKVA